MTAVALSAVASGARADDVAAVVDALVSSTDFRVRAAAALALGKARAAVALDPLVHALDDDHPTVRVAAAIAIGRLGAAALAALPALRRHHAVEEVGSVRAAIAQAIDDIGAAAAMPSASLRPVAVVQVGSLRVRGDHGEHVVAALRAATRAKLGALAGVDLLGEGIDVVAEGRLRRTRALLIDGSVERLERTAEARGVRIFARVEFIVRRVPEHALHGGGSGEADAIDLDLLVPDVAREASLETRAIWRAVDGAATATAPVLRSAVGLDRAPREPVVLARRR